MNLKQLIFASSVVVGCIVFLALVVSVTYGHTFVEGFFGVLISLGVGGLVAFFVTGAVVIYFALANGE